MRDSHFPVSIKTSPPSLKGVIERKRLLDALSSLQAPARWLQAPSGTGKSTLAASYARACKKPLVWYRLDERDNDPAFFYAEFAEAIPKQARLTKPLPQFSSDDHDRQQAFAQRFAAALSEQPAKPTLFVLDDVQTIANEAMQQAFATLVAAMTTGHELLFVSQSTAPMAFFDLIAARQLALLNDANLHFDLGECKQMISALRITGAHGESIAALTGGHAGALILACELLRGTDPKSALGVETVERVHSHLLTKLVERMPDARRELLLQTAFVTQLTRPIAEQLAGSDAAAEIEGLVDIGLLRRVGSATDEAFEAHGLVQQGMRALVQRRFPPASTRDLAEKTATVLAASSQADYAFGVLVEIGSTARALDVMQHLAERYAAQGQVDLLLASIAKLPATEVQRNAWLCFWVGQALLRINEEHARVWFDHAYAAFEAEGNPSGMRLAAASSVVALTLEWADLQQLDLWIARHAQAGGDAMVNDRDRFEPYLLMGLICAALVRGSYPPQIDADAVIARVRILLESPAVWLSDDQRVQAATILMKHGHAFVRHELARTIIIATRSLQERSTGGSLHRGRWLIAASLTQLTRGDVTEAEVDLSAARSLAEQSGSARLLFEVGFAATNHFLKSHDLQSAADELDRLEDIVLKAPPAQRAEYSRMKARLLLLQGRFTEGLQWAREAFHMAVPAGLTGATLRMFEIELIYALTANKRISEALELASKQEFEPREMRLAIENCLRFLLDNSDLQALRLALQNARQIGSANILDRARVELAQICEAALANGIESDYVLRLIAAKQLSPPTLAGPHWPWRVHVRALGGFRLDVEGKRYRPLHKAQDKPLELLKLLLTCQALGRDSTEKVWIAERLWPDAEIDNARKSLDMTLARLRRLLGHEESVIAHEGRLQLSTTTVWTDIRALLHSISHAQVKRDRHAMGIASPGKEAAASITTLLDNYTGPFLADEEGPAWLLAGREAIAARVRQALLAADAMLAGTADTVLISGLEKAFAADATSEDLAQALMRAHLRRGQNSEVIRVYRRLREMLSLLLSIAPSAESDDIRDRAYAAETKKIADALP
ncbi:MAG: BTAD domain-containing putative transcriptional regulator [Burkholderiaceae bacterium]